MTALALLQYSFGSNDAVGVPSRRALKPAGPQRSEGFATIGMTVTPSWGHYASVFMWLDLYAS